MFLAGVGGVEVEQVLDEVRNSTCRRSDVNDLFPFHDTATAGSPPASPLQQYGVHPDGHPWFKPVRFHASYRPNHDAWGRKPGEAPIIVVTDYYRVEGDEIHEVAVDPAARACGAPCDVRHALPQRHLPFGSAADGHLAPDGIVITGPVSENMRSALLDTYAAVPAPKLVIAVGACAISGGPFIDNPEVHNGCGSIVPVDLFIPGCPPHSMTILDGFPRLPGRLEDNQ